MAQGNVEVSQFFTYLANTRETEPISGNDATVESTGAAQAKQKVLTEKGAQVKLLVNEAMNDERNNDYWSAAQCYDKIVDLIPDGHPDVSQKVFDAADALRNVAQNQTEASMQQAEAAMKDLAPAIIEVFNPIQSSDIASSESPNLKRGDWITITDRTALYFHTQFYRYAEKGESFEVYEYRPNERRLYILSKDANGNPIGLNIPRQ
jgi:hypothetical protein